MRRRRLCRCGRWFVAGVAMALMSVPTVQAIEGTIQVELRGEKLEGTPLAWSQSQVALLGRDGRIWQFAPDEARHARRVSDRFQSYSAGEMRGMLQREFGARFEVSGTGHFLVVHPRGQRDQWAPRFEELYRSFVHYFHVRGFQLDDPPFPLVAVVFATRQEYQDYAQRHETPVSNQVVGYYSPISNRIMMYDATTQHDVSWQANLETLIHEAAHQSAFNTGIHDRYAPPPRWVCEGLGMLFEARGVYNSRAYPQQHERINQYRLERYRVYLKRRPAGALGEFLGSDRLFKTDPDAAYAEAWALTYFLCETRPKQFYQYLKLTAGEQAQRAAIDAELRLRMFQQAIGTPLNVLEMHYARFIGQIK